MDKLFSKNEILRKLQESNTCVICGISPSGGRIGYFSDPEYLPCRQKCHNNKRNRRVATKP